MFHHVPSFFQFFHFDMRIHSNVGFSINYVSSLYNKLSVFQGGLFSIFATLTCSRSFALYVDLQLKVVCYPNFWCFTPQYVYMIIYYIRSPTMLATVYYIYHMSHLIHSILYPT